MSLSAKEERRLIDKAVDEHLAAVVALKYQRNCLAPVSRLPPEILSWIFSCVKFTLQESLYRKSTAWIKVTHVSTHWRSIALNSPTLWVDPPPENSKWVAAMLERSKMEGLHIDTNLSTCVSRKVAGLKTILRQHGSRIRYLALSNVTVESRDILEVLPVSAPRLEVLGISSSLGNANSKDEICIPKTVLITSENLRHLELSACNVHWHCFSLANIAVLVILDIAYTARPTWTQFVNTLATMPKLEYLELKAILDPTIKFAVDTPSSLIHLSRLRRLSITSPITEVEMFFRHFTFPPSAGVYVRGIPESHSISEISAVISSIAPLFSDQEFLTLGLRELEIYGVNFVRFQLFLQVIERPNDFYVNMRAKAFTLEFRTSGEQVTVDEIIPEFFKNGLPLDKVSHAELAINVKNFDILADTLGNLPKLCYLRIEPESGTAFLNALYPHSDALDAEYFPLYFRNLVSIYLTVMFKSRRKYAQSSPHDISLQLLQDCLIQRYECGAEIQKLTLDNCHRLGYSSVRKLERIVVDVIWDEMWQGFGRGVPETTDDDEDDEEDDRG